VSGAAQAAKLMDRLGLDEAELCTILDADPIEIVSGALEHRPELGILLEMTGEVEGQVAAGVLPRWVRTAGPEGRPLELLLARDFEGFETALETLARRGFVIGG
jgi:hypothetical protein